MCSWVHAQETVVSKDDSGQRSGSNQTALSKLLQLSFLVCISGWAHSTQSNPPSSGTESVVAASFFPHWAVKVSRVLAPEGWGDYETFCFFPPSFLWPDPRWPRFKDRAERTWSRLEYVWMKCGHIPCRLPSSSSTIWKLAGLRTPGPWPGL